MTMRRAIAMALMAAWMALPMSASAQSAGSIQLSYDPGTPLNLTNLLDRDSTLWFHAQGASPVNSTEFMFYNGPAYVEVTADGDTFDVGGSATFNVYRTDTAATAAGSTLLNAAPLADGDSIIIPMSTDKFWIDVVAADAGATLPAVRFTPHGTNPQGALAAGGDGELQFNNGGVPGGSPAAKYDPVTGVVTFANASFSALDGSNGFLFPDNTTQPVPIDWEAGDLFIGQFGDELWQFGDHTSGQAVPVQRGGAWAGCSGQAVIQGTVARAHPVWMDLVYGGTHCMATTATNSQWDASNSITFETVFTSRHETTVTAGYLDEWAYTKGSGHFWKQSGTVSDRLLSALLNELGYVQSGMVAMRITDADFTTPPSKSIVRIECSVEWKMPGECVNNTNFACGSATDCLQWGVGGACDTSAVDNAMPMWQHFAIAVDHYEEITDVTGAGGVICLGDGTDPFVVHKSNPETVP